MALSKCLRIRIQAGAIDFHPNQRLMGGMLLQVLVQTLNKGFEAPASRERTKVSENKAFRRRASE